MHDDDFTKGLRGEFRGDFTRDTFDPLRRFSRVLMQQGRVQLDADWNEQVSIFSYYLRSLATHLIGPHGAPAEPDGTQGADFLITPNGNTFEIGYGHYYVDGILCANDKLQENDEPITYDSQRDYPLIPTKSNEQGVESFLVYLDVWERHLSYVEDDYMREIALGGPDTSTRAKIVWQVKLLNHDDFLSDEDGENDGIVPSKFKVKHDKFLQALTKAGEKRPGTGRLRARAKKLPKDKKDPCSISPEARFRGAENQLYRVEIHWGGEIRDDGSKGSNNNKVTFKWSRENGSVIFPIVKTSGKDVTLEHLGRDTRFSLKPNDWVEVVDDDYVLHNRAEELLQVDKVDTENSQVTLRNTPKFTIQEDSKKHPYLRRWDQTIGDGNGVPVKEGEGLENKEWIELENGVEIQFRRPSDGENAHVYHTGDYWLIPARTATGDVEWPGPEDNPYSLAAQGVEHHYAPLANIKVNNGTFTGPEDLRRHLKKGWA